MSVQWVAVAGQNDVAPGRGRTVKAGGRFLALFNDEGTFRAIDDACPHQGASLADGTLHDGRVICPLHAWVFELETGQCPRETHTGVRTYPTRLHKGRIEVEVPLENPE